MKDRKKPAIRFKGFTEDWEQRKLGEICQVTMGQSPDGSTYSETPSDYILVQGNADLKDGWVSPRIWTTQKTKTADAGDLIMSVRAPAGAMGKTTYNVVIGRGVAGIKGNEYIYQYLVKMDLDSYWKKLASGSTFESIKSEDINRAEFMMPRDVDEQDRIGEYFRNLNHLITLHQRKYDKLVNIKKSMLEKMFPREGKNVPDIRFSGFTEDWEQRKLGDCFTERVESMPDGELISVTIKDGIKKFSELGRHDNSNDDKSKYKKVCVGDIAYNSMRMWQGASGYSPYEGIVSPAYTVISPNLGIYSKCLAYQFKLPEMIRTFQVNSQGITSDNWNLKYPTLSQIEIFVSKDEEEQTQIAEYFANLDNLIALHQRKLEKLKNIKKSCLEKMFI